jgi:peptidoglycan LD-endopeptidase LytH
MKVLRLVTKWIFLISFATILIGYLIPNNVSSPIAKNDIDKIDPNSFWYYPWGESGVHKGIDMFSAKGTNVTAPVSGIVIKHGYGKLGGNYVYLLGPKWRTYYFAHLDTVFVSRFYYVAKGNLIGKVGNTGNAANKPTHLHYSIKTVFPYFWQYNKKEYKGWEKIFYINPNEQMGF